MAASRSHSPFTTLVLLSITGMTQGKSFDEILATENLLLYMSIAFLGVAGLFLFAVVLSVIIVGSRIRKMDRNDRQHEIQTNSTVFSNTYVLSEREQPLSDIAIWDDYLPRGKDIKNAKDGDNKGFMVYMETFATHNSDSGIRIPRAKSVNGDKN